MAIDTALDAPKKRLLVLTSTFPRFAGDKEPPFVFELSRRLRPYFDICVIAPRCPGCAERETLDGIDVIRFPYFVRRWESLAYEGGILARLRESKLRYFQVPFFLLGQTLVIVKVLIRWRCDIIHAHWIIPQGICALLARFFTGHKVKVVVTSHGGDLFALKYRALEAIKSRILRSSSHITVVSQAMKLRAESLGADSARISVIPMGVDLQSQFTPLHNTPRKTNELLFVGRLVEKKGVAHLLRAFSQLRKLYNDLQLRIVGDGPDASSLVALSETLGVRDAVLFFGSATPAELSHLYRQATVALVPSVVARGGDQEGFGLVIVEAMGCCCPVIVSDLPAVRDVANSDIALLVPPANYRALAAAIDRVLSNPDEARRRAEAARNWVLNRFDWERTAHQYADTLMKIANGNP